MSESGKEILALSRISLIYGIALGLINAVINVIMDFMPFHFGVHSESLFLGMLKTAVSGTLQRCDDI
jgi:hypothetical protein